MLNNTEQQISMSASLLHAFSEVNMYLQKLRNAFPDDSPLLPKIKVTLETLDMFEKAEISNLKNWCAEKNG